jgi:hypothetical protein
MNWITLNRRLTAVSVLLGGGGGEPVGDTAAPLHSDLYSGGVHFVFRPKHPSTITTGLPWPCTVPQAKMSG